MTERQIELLAEREMDALDRRLRRGALTQAEYDAEVRALDRRVADAIVRMTRGG